MRNLFLVIQYLYKKDVMNLYILANQNLEDQSPN